jgi:hypothetical protein
MQRETVCVRAPLAWPSRLMEPERGRRNGARGGLATMKVERGAAGPEALTREIR